MNLENYDDQHLIFGFLFMISNRLQMVGDTFYDEITAKQWFALAMLGTFEHGYAPTLRELSACMGSSHQNVKQIVLKLERSGLVSIAKDSDDRRSLRIHTTDKCLDFQTKYQHKEKLLMDQLFANIDPQSLRTTALTLLNLENNLKEMEK